MVKNSSRLVKFYQTLLKKEVLTYRQALLIYEALHREAVDLGAIGARNILEGIEVDIRIAKTLNSLAHK